MSLGRVSPRPVSSAWHQQKGQVPGEALTRVPEAPDVPRGHPPVAGARRGAGPQGRGWCAPRLWAAAAPHRFASVVISLHLEMRQSLPRTCPATAGGGYGFGPQVTGGENVLKLYVRSVLCTCDFYSFLSFYPLPKTLLINGIRLKHLKIAMCVSQKQSNSYFIIS